MLLKDAQNCDHSYPYYERLKLQNLILYSNDTILETSICPHNMAFTTFGICDVVECR